jgi:kinetochore protein Spc24
MTSIIDPADDYLTITAAEEQMKINYARGKKENEEAYADLKGMAISTSRLASDHLHPIPSLVSRLGGCQEILDATAERALFGKARVTSQRP